MKISFFNTCLQLLVYNCERVFTKFLNQKSSFSQMSLLSKSARVSNLAMKELSLLVNQEVDCDSLYTNFLNIEMRPPMLGHSTFSFNF